jgi:preprotein translocase subunit SecG
MTTLFLVLMVIVSVLLVLIILIQNSKGGGLASNMGISNQTLGVRKTTDVLEKGTWGLLISLVVLVVLSGAFYKTTSNNALDAAPRVKSLEEVPTIPSGAFQSEGTLQENIPAE